MATAGLSIIDYFSLESPFATEYRRLLHQLRTSREKPELKSVLVTSSSLAEGKSTTCALLALTAARKGVKVLLIDCDMRRPSVHKMFQVAREPGLIESLVDGIPAKNVIRKTSLPALDLITSGKVTAEPSENFNPAAIGEIISEMKFYYDLIVVDCAPVIPVSDPMLLAPEVDGTIMVVKAGKTPKELVSRATEILKSSGSYVVGVVLNNARNDLPYYYNYNYYEAGPSSENRSSRSKSGGPGGDSRKPGASPEMDSRRSKKIL